MAALPPFCGCRETRAPLPEISWATRKGTPTITPGGCGLLVFAIRPGLHGHQATAPNPRDPKHASGHHRTESAHRPWPGDGTVHRAGDSAERNGVVPNLNPNIRILYSCIPVFLYAGYHLAVRDDLAFRWLSFRGTCRSRVLLANIWRHVTLTCFAC